MFNDKSRVLQINKMFFLLPEEFDGSLSDALRSLATYLETETKKLPQLTCKIDDDPWQAFMEVASNGGKFSGKFAIHGYKGAENNWDELDLKVETNIEGE